MTGGLGFCRFLKQRYFSGAHDDRTEEFIVYDSRIEIKQIVMWKGYL